MIEVRQKIALSPGNVARKSERVERNFYYQTRGNKYQDFSFFLPPYLLPSVSLPRPLSLSASRSCMCTYRSLQTQFTSRVCSLTFGILWDFVKRYLHSPYAAFINLHKKAVCTTKWQRALSRSSELSNVFLGSVLHQPLPPWLQRTRDVEVFTATLRSASSSRRVNRAFPARSADIIDTAAVEA